MPSLVGSEMCIRDRVGSTLQELWLSYNFIDKLDGLSPCVKLTTLYISNNKLTNWEELDKLKELPEIQSVLFVENPIYLKDNLSKDEARIAVLRKLPTLKNIDGVTITEKHLEKLNEAPKQIKTNDWQQAIIALCMLSYFFSRSRCIR
eukprot:TRINITY_DN1610_c0_g1_i7.p2 TRINITY_DN1610_c0_g1~~TRINITY_DN1610_c0_g1_i7.p2  ORF type:complete len:148 (-),score=43.14 TRINITY_DN1610_c0_g1_i7:210-653(-)